MTLEECKAIAMKLAEFRPVFGVPYEVSQKSLGHRASDAMFVLLHKVQAMSDHDRRLADIEKRLARLESLERRAPMTFGPAPKTDNQWCDCGRDGCRWPYCKTRENNCGNDPLGR